LISWFRLYYNVYRDTNIYHDKNIKVAIIRHDKDLSIL